MSADKYGLIRDFIGGEAPFVITNNLLQSTTDKPRAEELLVEFIKQKDKTRNIVYELINALDYQKEIYDSLVEAVKENR